MGYPTDEDFAEAHGWNRDRPRLSQADVLRMEREKKNGCYRLHVHEGILQEVEVELKRASDLGFGLFNSAHEGFAVLLEEVDELKAHVWMKQTKRDVSEMRKEAIECAAMAVKFVQSVDKEFKK